MLRDVHPIPDNPGIEQPGQAGVGAAVVGLPPAGTACANASRWAANRIDAFKAS